jgi:uncharacterized protein YcnI
MRMKRIRFMAIGLVAASVLVLAAPASAHVTVNPGDATKGGFAKLTFRVPNERDDAGTTLLEVNFPTETPIGSVRVKETPGWDYVVEMGNPPEGYTVFGNPVSEIVAKITWTPTDPDGLIGVGEFGEFDVSAGPLPTDVDEILFPTLQTYEGGEVVRWIDEPAADGEDAPERPAPRLVLVDEPGSEDTPVDEDAGEDAGDDALEVVASPVAAEKSDETPLAIAGIVLGLLGLVVGGIALGKSKS